MIFPSFAALQKKNNGPLGGVQPDALDASRKRQQAAATGAGGGYGSAISPVARLAKAQDAATIATAKGDPNAAAMASNLQRQREGLREQQLTKEAEAVARIKAKAEAAGEAAKSGVVNLGAVGGGHGFTGGVEGYSGGENGNAAGISVEQMNAYNTPERQAERDAGIFFRSQKDRRRG